MKCAVLIILILSASFLWGQNSKSDLYVKVDSIIKFELKYRFDSLKSVVQKHVWEDTTVHKGFYPSFSSFPEHPPPLINLDATIYQIEELNEYSLRQIEKIIIYPPGDSISTLLYGNSAMNGAIFITTKKHARSMRKYFRKEKKRGRRRSNNLGKVGCNYEGRLKR